MDLFDFSLCIWEGLRQFIVFFSAFSSIFLCSSIVNRAAIEHEKKTHVINLEERQALEKNMITVAHELDRLHAELANAEKRFRAAAAAAAAANPNPGHAASYGNPEMGYGGSPHIEPHAIHRGGANALPYPAP
ncbi:protein FLC EXPRESSOR-like [Carica papaya]|uniref:protein FLC EXPRESSOR-like n=1 Tax=Carica papaya TaxID=3649 RepID=UPI000B8D12BF|nr:protein FLC EXPRESSOR-like [Carica papaya]